VIDRAVVDFTAGLMDILMDLAFGQAPSGDRWRNCRIKLAALGQALQVSAPPNWVDPPARAQSAQLQSLVDENNLLSMDGDSEDESYLSLSVPLDLASPHELPVSSSSLAGPSTSTLAIAPVHQARATVDDVYRQGLPAANAGTPAQLLHLQRLLKRTRRSLKIARRMLTALISFLEVGYLIKSLFDASLWVVV
jgi:hypothetical protein